MRGIFHFPGTIQAHGDENIPFTGKIFPGSNENISEGQWEMKKNWQRGENG